MTQMKLPGFEREGSSAYIKDPPKHAGGCSSEYVPPINLVLDAALKMVKRTHRDLWDALKAYYGPRFEEVLKQARGTK